MSSLVDYPRLVKTKMELWRMFLTIHENEKGLDTRARDHTIDMKRLRVQIWTQYVNASNCRQTADKLQRVKSAQKHSCRDPAVQTVFV